MAVAERRLNPNEWVVDGDWAYRKKANPGAGDSRLRQFVNWMGSDDGQFRSLQTVFKTINLGEQVAKDLGKEFSPALKGAAKASGAVWMGLIIPIAPKLVLEAFDAVGRWSQVNPQDLKETLPGEFQRIEDTAIQKVASAAAGLGYSASLIAGCMPGKGDLSMKLKEMGDIPDALDNYMTMNMTLENRTKALEKASSSTVEADQKLYQETARYNLLKALKAVCSVAGFIFGMMALPPALAVVALTVSLAGAVFGASATLYKNSMEFKPLELFDANPKNLQHSSLV